MSSSSTENLRCRLCLCLCNRQELVTIILGDTRGPLHNFALELLTAEIAKENIPVCCNCFTMWNMMQDFLNTCFKANEVLQLNEQMALRKSWVVNDDEKDMFITVCRVVKRHFYGMEKLLCSLKPPVFLSPQVQKKPVKVKEPNFRPGTSVRTYSKSPGKSRTEKVSKIDNPAKPVSIKQEKPIEIDDSEAFLMVKSEPVEVSLPNHQIDFVDDDANIFKEQTMESVGLLHNGVQDKHEEEDGSTACYESSRAEVMVKLEPTESSNFSQLDFLDNDANTLEEQQMDLELQDSVQDIHKEKESSLPLNEKSLKTICQVCGTKTNNMATHLESHTQKPKEKRIPKRARKSSASSGLSIISYEQQKIPAGARLSCEVCGILFSNMLVARIHARSHLSGRPIKKEDLFGVS
ncbi:uncharacterized protein LOC129717065 [Wyeomyia smithii]|uniref:uncharacterized protein LOC129717065 n=1 Tax=Wyeomyia smithii TaxID=174621 RepID=UPI002467B784|nr:uncharacterized protein LOC129717065 [Wyeomyia smithii]